MSAAPAVLQGVVFGEFLEGPHQRSLGFRLLAPLDTPWAVEVESLARRLQAAPYPEHWPQTELFCSVLLGDGRRLVAKVRYGVTDQTATRRHGGLELLGVVGPANLSVFVAQAIYLWLKQQNAINDPTAFAGDYDLTDVLAQAPSPPPSGDPVPVLPIKLGQEGALLFAAPTPTEPDLRLGMLDQSSGGHWQWLPLVGGDFPLATYSARGPLIAWTPYLSGVAVKLDHRPPTMPAQAPASRRLGPVVVAVCLVFLLAANLWAMLDIRRRLTESAPTTSRIAQSDPQPIAVPSVTENERVALALYQYLDSRGELREARPEELTALYDRLAAQDERFRVTSREARLALGAVVRLARRSPTRIEDSIRQALDGKGYDPELIALVCSRVRAQLTGEKETP